MLVGSTGEGASLTPQEIQELIGVARDENREGVPVVSGVIADDTREALVYSRAAKDAGADGLLITPIHYAVPTADGMVAFFNAIAAEVGLPVIIYNVVRQALIDVDLMARIADEIDLVIGVKEGIAGIEQTSEMVRRLGQRLSFMSNYDRMLFSAYMLGVDGTIGAVSTIATDPCIRMYRALQEGDVETARQIHFRLFPLADRVFGAGFIQCIKEVLRLQGCDCGFPRSPLFPVSADESRQLQTLMQGAGLL